MVIDTSALVAILKDEPQRAALSRAIVSSARCQMSAATLVEAGIVMQGQYGNDGARRLDRLLLQTEIEIVPLTTAHADLAREAFRRFGKGRHPAGLNFGDCFAYALATALGEPLLFVGDDFGQTDVGVAAT